eukprot:2574553-Rhodomonas_salina.1
MNDITLIRDRVVTKKGKLPKIQVPTQAYNTIGPFCRTIHAYGAISHLEYGAISHVVLISDIMLVQPGGRAGNVLQRSFGSHVVLI